jgi:hypothetical protein
LKLFHPQWSLNAEAEDSSDWRCPNLDGARELCDTGQDPAQLDLEHQKLLFDASGDFIAVAAEDYARSRGAIQLPTMRHEDSLML